MPGAGVPTDDLDAVIARLVETFPPLTERQKARLAAIFAGSHVDRLKKENR